jgi:hypothetical protein
MVAFPSDNGTQLQVTSTEPVSGSIASDQSNHRSATTVPMTPCRLEARTTVSNVNDAGKTEAVVLDNDLTSRLMVIAGLVILLTGLV